MEKFGDGLIFGVPSLFVEYVASCPGRQFGVRTVSIANHSASGAVI